MLSYQAGFANSSSFLLLRVLILPLRLVLALRLLSLVLLPLGLVATFLAALFLLAVLPLRRLLRLVAGQLLCLASLLLQDFQDLVVRLLGEFLTLFGGLGIGEELDEILNVVGDLERVTRMRTVNQT